MGGPQGTPGGGGPPPPQASHRRQWTRCSHLARVGLPAAVDLTEATSPDDAVHTEVVHGQLRGWQQGLGEEGHCRLPGPHPGSSRGLPQGPTQGHPHPSQVPPCLEPSALGSQHQPHSRPWGLKVDFPRCPRAWGGAAGRGFCTPTQPTYMDVELYILPLAKSCEFIAAREERTQAQMSLRKSEIDAGDKLALPTAIAWAPKPQGPLPGLPGRMPARAAPPPSRQCQHCYRSLGFCLDQINLEVRSSHLTLTSCYHIHNKAHLISLLAHIQ